MNDDRLRELQSGEIDPEIARLIREVAAYLSRCSGFSFQDRADLESDLYVTVLEHVPKFDPRRGNAAAYVNRIVRTRARLLLRKARALKRDHRTDVLSLNAPIQSCDGEAVELVESIDREDFQHLVPNPAPPVIVSRDLAIDFGRVFQELSPDLQLICSGLAEGLEASRIARMLGITRQALYTRYQRLRRIFSAAGLDAYLHHVPPEPKPEDATPNPRRARETDQRADAQPDSRTMPRTFPGRPRHAPRSDAAPLPADRPRGWSPVSRTIGSRPAGAPDAGRLARNRG